MVILVDTNVVLDFLVVRKPYFDNGNKLSGFVQKIK